MIQPFGDVVLVEIEKSQWATADTEGERDDPRVGTGKVVAIPRIEDMLCLSSFTWVAEESLFNETQLSEVHATMQRLLGKRIYWEKRADIGMTSEDSSYALIKLTKIVGYEDM